MMYDSSDTSFSSTPTLGKAGGRRNRGPLPMLCEIVFRIGMWGGIARIPVFCVLVLIMPYFLRLMELGSGADQSKQIISALVYAVGVVAVLGILGNLALLFGRPFGLILAGPAFGAASLAYIGWFLLLGIPAVLSTTTEPHISIILALVLFARLAFLFSYAVALLQFCQWLRRPEQPAVAGSIS